MKVLLTGATGTFGTAFLESVSGEGGVIGCTRDCNSSGVGSSPAPPIIRAFSRDEFKQSELAPRFPSVRWLIGDVRDRDRLRRAMEGCDTVVHAAALKHVTACEQNPGEALKTNSLGSWNVVEAALDAGVKRAVLISSDKAVHPVNAYGASKALAEKLWLAAGAYGGGRCMFSVVRYGNVRGSRGSVLTKGKVSLTDVRATRFWMEASEAVSLVLLALREMQGGEIFVPKLPSSLVAEVIEHDGTETGLRPGEKLHEQLISDEEIPRTLDFVDHYRVVPQDQFEEYAECTAPRRAGLPVPADFRYVSAS